ncbi:MAG: hypothetical protein EPO00_01585 [Chloroflexota bacterium]|nr:MAG: hypothetical protein EPO00_01585 [Chloroflexota bacterium]
MTTRIALALETTAKRTFASAIDWPGLARSGKTESAAIEALLGHLDRYAEVALAAGYELAANDLVVEVIEAAEGNASTDFGVPGRVTDADRRPTTAADAERLAGIVAAAWALLDRNAATAPEELRKGPRGGGRSTSKIVEHTLMSDHAYAREMGLKVPAPSRADGMSITALRDAMTDVLRRPSDGTPLAGRRWTSRYAAHRIAWHALDHAWEIEDRSEPTT